MLQTLKRIGIFMTDTEERQSVYDKKWNGGGDVYGSNREEMCGAHDRNIEESCDVYDRKKRKMG